MWSHASSATLYLDAYHYAEPMAPHGFICARPLTRGLPEPDLLRAPAELDALAAEIAAAPGFRAGPVDLGGEPPIGLLFDAFRIKSRRIRGAAQVAPFARGSRSCRPQRCDARSIRARDQRRGRPHPGARSGPAARQRRCRVLGGRAAVSDAGARHVCRSGLRIQRPARERARLHAGAGGLDARDAAGHLHAAGTG